MRMSRRNTRHGKARRRAERDRSRPTGTSDPGPRAVEDEAVQAVQAALRPDGSGSRDSDKRDPGLRSDADGALTAVDPDEAELDTDADLDDFADLDLGDADLQATLTVLAVLADDIADVADMAEMGIDDLGVEDLGVEDLGVEDLGVDIDIPEGPDELEELDRAEPDPPSA